MGDFETYDFFDAQKSKGSRRAALQPAPKRDDLAVDAWSGIGARIVNYLRAIAHREKKR